MDLASIGHLLKRIMIHYPSFKNHITDSSGLIVRAVGEEWERRIGFMEFEDALKLLDVYLDLPEEQRRKAPDTSWFLQSSRREKEVRESYKSEGLGQYLIDKEGHLTNYEKMIFAYPGMEETVYYYTTRGDIAYKNSAGQEIVDTVWEEVNRRRQIAEMIRREAQMYEANKDYKP